MKIYGNRNLPEGTEDRPLVTFALFAYNQEKYIREAVEGAFSQTYEPLEIILSDDCSSDRTYEIMEEMAAAYDGPHQVRVRRNDRNFGLARHVNEVFGTSNGTIIIVAAGDDISLPERTSISVKLLRDNPDTTAALISAEVMDEDGRTKGKRLSTKHGTPQRFQSFADLIAWRHRTFGAGRAIRKEVHTLFGLLEEDCPTEDTPLLLRSLICGENILSSEIGIRYRRHDNNLSGIVSLGRMDQEQISKQYLKDIAKADSLGKLNEKTREDLIHWVEGDRLIRSLRKKASLGRRYTGAEWRTLLGHPALGFRERSRLLLRGITGL